MVRQEVRDAPCPVDLTAILIFSGPLGKVLNDLRCIFIASKALINGSFPFSIEVFIQLPFGVMRELMSPSVALASPAHFCFHDTRLWPEACRGAAIVCGPESSKMAWPGLDLCSASYSR